MEKEILLLAAQMLEEASEQFSCNSCNDLSKKSAEMITPEILEDYNKWLIQNVEGVNGDDEVDDIDDATLADYLSDKLRKGAK